MCSHRIAYVASDRPHLLRELGGDIDPPELTLALDEGSAACLRSCYMHPAERHAPTEDRTPLSPVHLLACLYVSQSVLCVLTYPSAAPGLIRPRRAIPCCPTPHGTHVTQLRLIICIKDGISDLLSRSQTHPLLLTFGA